MPEKWHVGQIHLLGQQSANTYCTFACTSNRFTYSRGHPRPTFILSYGGIDAQKKMKKKRNKTKNGRLNGRTNKIIIKNSAKYSDGKSNLFSAQFKQQDVEWECTMYAMLEQDVMTPGEMRKFQWHHQQQPTLILCEFYFFSMRRRYKHWIHSHCGDVDTDLENCQNESVRSDKYAVD